MSIGRPLEYDPAKALDVAMETFWRCGYEGTSLNDLLIATGLSKSSFYHAFNSKHQIFQRALTRYSDVLTERLRDKLLASNSGWDFIESVMMTAVSEARESDCPRGCMIVNVATEFSNRDARIGKLVTDGVKRITQIFSAAVKRAQKEGSIPAEKDPNLLGRYLLSSLSGLRTLVKAGNSHTSIAGVVTVIMASLK